MGRTVLLLYVPAIHQSYIKLFEKYKKVDALYLIGQEIIDQFPLLQREIRAISPETAQQLIQKAGYFKNVEVVDISRLKKLAVEADITIIMSVEYIFDELIKNYFSKTKVKRENIFLRFDERIVMAARKEVPFTGTVTSDEFHRKIIKQVEMEKEKNTEWFLRVGAAIIINDPIPAVLAHNMRMPSTNSLWIIGDLRMYVEYGTDSHRRTTLHAEQAAIAHAARHGIKVDGASLYVTAFPCPDCANNIAEAGIKRVYFKEGYSELSSDDTFKTYNIEIIKVV